jgi:integrase
MTETAMVKWGPLEALLAKMPSIYKYPARRFVTWVETSGLPAGDPATWRAYLAWLKKGGRYAAATINVNLCAMKRVLRLGLKAEVFNMTAAEASAVRDELDELKGVQKPEPSDYVPAKVMTAAEVALLMEEARLPKWGEDHRTARPDVALWIGFLWETGCRVSEMTGVTLANIKRANDTYSIRIKGKGAKERWLKIGCPELIDEIRQHFGSTEFLFEHRNEAQEIARPYTAGHVSMAIHRLGWTVLGKRISAHALRHSHATHLYALNHDAVALQHDLGHSNVATTLTYYAHSVYDPTWRAAALKLPSRAPIPCKADYPTGSEAAAAGAPA